MNTEVLPPTLSPIPAVALGPYTCVLCRRVQSIIYPGSDQVCPECYEKTEKFDDRTFRDAVTGRHPASDELAELRSQLQGVEADLEEAQDRLDEARKEVNALEAEAAELDEEIGRAERKEKDRLALATLTQV